MAGANDMAELCAKYEFVTYAVEDIPVYRALPFIPVDNNVWCGHLRQSDKSSSRNKSTYSVVYCP